MFTGHDARAPAAPPHRCLPGHLGGGSEHQQQYDLVRLGGAGPRRITANLTDAANLGNNSARIEIIVLGTLAVNGSTGSTVTFTSAGSTAGSWAGLRIETGGTLTATSVIVEEALNGIACNGTVTVSDAGVDAGMMNSDAGVSSNDGGPVVMPDGGSVTIIGNSSGCGCSSSDAMAPLFGLLLLALRRRVAAGGKRRRA